MKKKKHVAKIDTSKKRVEEDKLYKEAIIEWRKEHFLDIMEKGRKVLEEIRDKASVNVTGDRNKIEAIKILARMVAGLKEGKEEEKVEKKIARKMERELNKEELAKIEELKRL